MSHRLLRIGILLCLFFSLEQLVAQDIHSMAIEFLSSRGMSAEKIKEAEFKTVYLDDRRIVVQQSLNYPSFVAFYESHGQYQIAGYSLENIFISEEKNNNEAEALLDGLTTLRIKTFQFDGDGPSNIQPLISTRWSQGPFFNRDCPEELELWHGRALVGCVAVAMGQIIHHYGESNSFVLDESYHAGKYGQLSAWSNGYEYSKMLEQPLDYDLEISRFLSDIGILVHTNYSKAGSSASTGMALRGFEELGYSNAYRVSRRDYNRDEWMDLIYSNLADYNPVFVAGGGHAFVCDGYDDNGYLHFNLGGAGMGDGYYSSSVVFGYTVQEAIVGLYPDNVCDHPRELSVGEKVSDNLLTWSSPKQSGQYSYKVYLDQELIGETSDTIYNLNGLGAGHFNATVRARSSQGESIPIGPVEVRVAGAEIPFTDPELIQAISFALQLGSWPGTDLVINEAELSQIKILDLHKVVSNISDIESFRNVQKLSLNCEGFNEESYQSILKMERLQVLELHKVELLKIPDLRPFNKLVSLDIIEGFGSQFQLTNSLPKLRRLKLNKLEELEDFTIDNLPFIEELEISSSGLRNFSSISDFPRLRTLNLSDNNLVALYFPGNHLKVQDLILNDNQIVDVQFLKFFPNLTRLSIKHNQLKNLVFDSKLDMIYSADFTGNSITELRIAFDLPNLYELDLSYNTLHSLPENLLSLKNLRKLDLSNNSIHQVPRMASQYLSQLDLSNNDLSHIPDFANYLRLRRLDISSNQFSDLSPLAQNIENSQINYLDIRQNPISLESFENHIDKLENRIQLLYKPDKPQLLAPCFPGPGVLSKSSSRRVTLSWYTGDDETPQDYEVLIGEGDSLKVAYTVHGERSVKASFSEGQVYNWQVRTVLPDTSFYSGLYEIRTLDALQIPFFEDFEGYPLQSGLTASSNIWRISHSQGETYRDAKILSTNQSQGQKALFINPQSDIALDLDHLSEALLKVMLSVKVSVGRSAHFFFDNINGLKINVFLNDGLGEVWLNGSLMEIFDYPNNQWVDYELSILGKSNRIFFRRNHEVVLSTQWEFSDGMAHIDKLRFCQVSKAIYQHATVNEFYLDNVQVKTLGVSGINEFEINNQPELIVYPNPATDYLYIKGLPGGYASCEIRLVAMDGTRVYHENLPPGSIDTQIQLADVPTGLYICQILYPGRNPVNQKILVQSKTL